MKSKVIFYIVNLFTNKPGVNYCYYLCRDKTLRSYNILCASLREI
jgi:hypothetical protein